MNPGPHGTPALAPTPPTGAGTGTAHADADGDLPWRPSRVRMARADPDRVTPRRGAVALPALASGVGLALSLPPWGLWVLAFPAAGLLWWRLGGLRARTRLWAGWLAGLGTFVPGLLFARSFTLAGAVVLIAVEALFMGAACLAVPRGPVVARALAFPAALTLAEAARQTWPFGGLPIGGVFLGQAGGPLLGVARLGGPLGLTATVFTGGVATGALGLALGRTVRNHRRAGAFDRLHPEPDRPATWRRAVAGVGTLAATGAVALVAVAGSGVVAAHAPDGGPVVRSVTAAAVQGGGLRGFSKSQVDPATVLHAAVAATDRLLPRPGAEPPTLVLWPEDVVSLGQPLADDPEQGALSSLAVALHATLVVGVTEDLPGTAYRNEMVAFGPDGAIVDRFTKVHRVPFGEYVPFRSFFAHLGDLSAVPRDAVPGTGSGMLTTPAGRLGTLISYEVFYAERGRSSVRAGAQVLIVPTNTSSYATAQIPTQEIAASEVQAVQQGRDLLQAAPTGYSAWITHRGVLLERSVLGARQIVPATLGLRDGWTVYVRWGDTPVLVASALALLVGWWLAARARRSRRPDGRRPAA